MVIAGVILGLGSSFPLLGPWLKSVPPFSHFRHSAMWMALADIGLAWIGAIGCDELFRAYDRSRRGPVVRCCIWTAFLMAIALALGYACHNRYSHWLLQPAFILGIAALLGRLSKTGLIRPGIFILGIIGLLYAELVSTGLSLHPTARTKSVMYLSREEQFLQSHVGLESRTWGRVMRWPAPPFPGSRDDEIIAGKDRDDLVRNLRASLQPNLPAVVGCRQIDGDNPLVPNAIRRTLEALSTGKLVTGGETLETLSHLGVRYLLATKDPGIRKRPILEGRLKIYLIPKPRPMAWLEPRNAGEVRVMKSSAGLWDLRVKTDIPAELIVNKTFVNGWRADTDRGRLGIRPTTYGTIGIQIPAGLSHIRIAYRPWEVYAGLAIGFVSLTLIFLSALIHRNKTRSPQT